MSAALEPDAVEPGDYLSTLLNLGRLLNTSLDLRRVLDTAIDQVITFVGADRGFILLVDVETGRVWGEAMRHLDKAALEDTLSGRDPTNRAEISRTLVEQALDTQEPVLSHNAMEDPRFSDRQSVQLASLRSVLCVPLIAQSRLLGVIYVDNRVKSGLFTEQHLTMLSAFANQAAVAIQNARLYENLRRSMEERLQLQDEIHRQETQRLALEEAARLKSDFLNFVAHELRNPLTTIKGNVETLLADIEGSIDDATRREFYEIIEVDADRLLDLINELLDVSRVEAGRPLTLMVRPVHVRSLLDRQARRQRYDKYFTRKHLVATDFAPDLPDEIVTDPEKLNHILSNLLGNAVKYSPEGGLVTISAAPDGPDAVTITVEDNGVGLSEVEMARLFRKYERIERASTRNIPGTGLGLFLVKNLVDLLGGTISCRSTPDQGTSFTVRLPAAPTQR